MNEGHETVLLHESVDALRVNPSDVVVDATIGGGGHLRLLASALSAEGTCIGIDADSDAIARGKEALSGMRCRTIIAHDNFRNLSQILEANGITTIDKALFDLGWSSYHLTSGRGFTFRATEPLLMNYDARDSAITAADIVNGETEEAIADILFTLGEERFARSIARSIVEKRAQKRLLTTQDLVEAVEAGTPRWYQTRRIHPATKTFQALRMYVNDELGALREGLAAALTHLSIGGRVAVITFHSIEDRVVKLMLKDAAHQGLGVLVNKKPITPSFEETKRNPRARSAKLRVFEKTEAYAPLTNDSPVYAYA